MGETASFSVWAGRWILNFVAMALCAFVLSACQSSSSPFEQLALAAASETQGATEQESDARIEDPTLSLAAAPGATEQPDDANSAPPGLALRDAEPVSKPVEAVTKVTAPAAESNDETPVERPVQQAALPGRLYHTSFKPMVREPNFFERATLRRLHYEPLIRRVAQRHGVPPKLAMAIVEIESNFRRDATGLVGEVGLMQVRPRTARGLGFTGTNQELYDPETNLNYGMQYLAEAHRRGGGTTCGTILKYNAGHYAKRMNPTSAKYCKRVRKVMARR